MKYEPKVHYQNYMAFYEHRLDDRKAILKTGVEKLVPLVESGPWTPFQQRELLKNDLIEFTEEPFQLPPPRQAIRKPVDNSQDHNFVHVNWFKTSFTEMLDLLFDGSPPGGYKFETFDDSAIMAHLVAKAGAFKSVGDARRNGWDKPIPEGYSDHTIGKRKIQVNILNKHPEMFDPACNYFWCRCDDKNRGYVKCPFEGT